MNNIGIIGAGAIGSAFARALARAAATSENAKLVWPL
jgi:ketopantoate reductase